MEHMTPHRENIEVFRTNVKRTSDAVNLVRQLNHLFPGCRFTFDLDDRDRILRVAGQGYCIEDLIHTLLDAGFHCQILE